VVKTFQDHDTHCERVPPGLTFLNQPIDVGIAKPFKHGVKLRWEQHMYAMFDRNRSYEKPTREEIARWVSEAWDDVRPNVIQNALRHDQYNLIEEPLFE
jgi:hypothetical protein